MMARVPLFGAVTGYSSIGGGSGNSSNGQRLNFIGAGDTNSIGQLAMRR
jgi:hypothetical protein